MKHVRINFLPKENWYGGSVTDGFLFPFTESDYKLFDFSYNDSYNQTSCLFISNLGRYIWLNDNGLVLFNYGVIEIDSDSVILDDSSKSLKEAYLKAMKNHVTIENSVPDEFLFNKPQVCSWIHLKKNQNQKDLLAYAKDYIAKGGEPGLFIIDDGWQENYGNWDFNKEKFENPKTFIRELHELGFKVSLWLVPYVMSNCESLRILKENNALLCGDDKKPLIAHWFDGESYIADFSNEFGKKWLNDVIDGLKEKYGIDAFKLDCGDSLYLPRSTKNTVKYTDDWVKAVDRNKNIIEYRCCHNFGGKKCVQRLADKAHLWGVEYCINVDNESKAFLKYGLQSIIPGVLAQGLLGYHYSCPDMVGGGLACGFNEDNLDKELLIRWCQASALLPMIQFSFAYWKSKDKDIRNCFKDVMKIRNQMVPYIVDLAKEVPQTNLPIVRMMEFEFPHQGFEKNICQFMLGDKYLVAPIIDKGQKMKTVYFPKDTTWENVLTGDVIKCNEKTFKVDMKTMLVFKKI